MSKYTTTFKDLINMKIFSNSDLVSWFTDYELSDYLTNEEISVINARGTWSKSKLAQKIIDNYYFREFAFETPYIFKKFAKISMQRIMEEKLPLIYSASISYDPLVNVDYHETFTRDVNGSVNSSGLSVSSDTPQGQIDKTSILNGSYASSTGAEESDGTSTENETYDKHVKGNSGVSATNQAMIKQYRQNIIAIDSDIINSLDDLFMGLF